jgi:hypothetical protein
MRIISKFKDYYDGFAVYNKTDPLTKVWVRDEKRLVRINKSILTILEDRAKRIKSNNDWYGGYLIISGTVIPFVKLREASGLRYNSKGNIYFFEQEEHLYFDFNILEQEQPDIISETHYYKKEIKAFFTASYPNMNNICIGVKSPIVLIEPNQDYYKEIYCSLRNCYVNINLKNFGLSKILSAPILYQMLDYFISNVMVDDVMPISSQTDIEKVQSHGFDKVTSFRNMKRE